MEKLKQKIGFKKHWEWYAFVLILCWFVFQALYFARNVRYGIPPDEAHHLGLIRTFAKTIFVPQNSLETYKYGAMESQPWLYYWIMARFSSIHLWFITEIIWLRLINVVFSIGTIIFTFATVKKVLRSKLAQLLVVIMLTNTLMFTFLSGAVNYDNLANLCASWIIYNFVRYIQNHKTEDLVSIFIGILFATMVKNSLWPFVFIVVLILGWVIMKDHRTVLKDIMEYLHDVRFKKVLGYAVIGSLLIVNLYYFGNNIIKYKSIKPSCIGVLSHDDCMKYGIYKRDYGFKETIDDRESLTFVEYAENWWSLIPPRIFGIMAHKNMIREVESLKGYSLVFSVALIFIARFWKSKDREMNFFGIITAFYVLFLLVVFNYYLVYRSKLIPGLAVQGRYLFPVIGLAYIIVCQYLFKLNNSIWRILVFVIISLVFISGCFPYFISNATVNWFNKYDVVQTGSTVNNNDHIPGGIVREDQFTQTFYSEKDGLWGLEIFVSTFGGKDLDDYKLLLYEEDCSTFVAKVFIHGEDSSKKDNSYFTFLFNETIESEDKDFCFTINPINKTVTHPITLQQSSPGTYELGNYNINGEPSEKDIVFNLIYEAR